MTYESVLKKQKIRLVQTELYQRALSCFFGAFEEATEGRFASWEDMEKEVAGRLSDLGEPSDPVEIRKVRILMYKAFAFDLVPGVGIGISFRSLENLERAIFRELARRIEGAGVDLDLQRLSELVYGEAERGTSLLPDQMPGLEDEEREPEAEAGA